MAASTSPPASSAAASLNRCWSAGMFTPASGPGGAASGLRSSTTSTVGFAPSHRAATVIRPGSNPGASAVNVHCPLRRPSIPKRPLGSVVATIDEGAALGFSAVIVAPLIGWSSASLTVPVTRPCASASALVRRSTAAAAKNRRLGQGIGSQKYNPVPMRSWLALACFVTSFAPGLSTPAAAQRGASARPASVRGVDASRFEAIVPLVEAAIAEKKLPGAVVLVGRGDRVLYQKAMGNPPAQPPVEPMTLDTIFDL